MKCKLGILIGRFPLITALSASAYYEDFYNLYMNPQLGPAYGYRPYYGYTYSPTYDSSSNWQRGWLGNNYLPGQRHVPGEGWEAATYPPMYGTAKYNPYADDRNFEMYEQVRDTTRTVLQANEEYDDMNYPAKQFAYMDFFARTNPINQVLTPVLYPYGKKPYFRKYGTNPWGQGYLTEGTNPFWGTLYARNFHCHGPNFGCHVHNVFPDSA